MHIQRTTGGGTTFREPDEDEAFYAIVESNGPWNLRNTRDPWSVRHLHYREAA